MMLVCGKNLIASLNDFYYATHFMETTGASCLWPWLLLNSLSMTILSVLTVFLLDGKNIQKIYFHLRASECTASHRQERSSSRYQQGLPLPLP